jgi:hypothetical protein
MQTVMVFEHHMLLRVFDTQFGAQGMENIGEIRYCLVPLLTQGGPFGALLLVSSNKVVLFFKDILEGIPCGGDHKYCRFLYDPFLRISMPLVLNMGDDLEECKSIFFPIKKIVDRKNTLQAYSTIYLQHLHLSVLQIMEYQNLHVP